MHFCKGLSSVQIIHLTRSTKLFCKTKKDLIHIKISAQILVQDSVIRPVPPTIYSANCYGGIPANSYSILKGKGSEKYGFFEDLLLNSGPHPPHASEMHVAPRKLPPDRGGRYVLIIHFYVESGQKMIQFNIQFKIESKIFIQ